MAALALLALALWIGGGRWLHAAGVALVTFSLMLVAGVGRWDDVLGHRRAWNYLVWFATLVALADGLSRVGVLAWFAARVSTGARELPVSLQVAFVLVVFFISHYLFASLTAHATALLPALMTAVVATPGLPVSVVLLGMSYTLGLMGVLTPYATGAAPLYFSSGYLRPGQFWMLGLIFGVMYLAVMLGLELPYLRWLQP